MVLRYALAFSLLALFVSAAFGQASESSNVSAGFVLGNLCQNSGTTHAACKGSWQSGNGLDTLTAGGSSSVSYGYLKAETEVVVNCSAGCILSGQGVASSSFTDQANIENAPATGAYFLVAVSVSGSVSNSQTAITTLQLDINGGAAQCAVLASSGSCYAYLPVTNSTQSFGFSLGLTNSTSADLYGVSGTDTEYGQLSGKVTKLAVVNNKGQVINGVVITTASGHTYPL
jgi:hypothetical protein